jgi:hypothetical protein
MLKDRKEGFYPSTASGHEADPQTSGMPEIQQRGHHFR